MSCWRWTTPLGSPVVPLDRGRTRTRRGAWARRGAARPRRSGLPPPRGSHVAPASPAIAVPPVPVGSATSRLGSQSARDRAQLLRFQERVQRDGDRSRRDGSPEDGREERPVREHQRHPIPAPNAGSRDRTGERPDPPVELAVGRLAIVRDNGDACPPPFGNVPPDEPLRGVESLGKPFRRVHAADETTTSPSLPPSRRLSAAPATRVGLLASPRANLGRVPAVSMSRRKRDLPA